MGRPINCRPAQTLDLEVARQRGHLSLAFVLPDRSGILHAGGGPALATAALR